MGFEKLRTKANKYKLVCHRQLFLGILVFARFTKLENLSLQGLHINESVT